MHIEITTVFSAREVFEDIKEMLEQHQEMLKQRGIDLEGSYETDQSWRAIKTLEACIRAHDRGQMVPHSELPEGQRESVRE